MHAALGVGAAKTTDSDCKAQSRAIPLTRAGADEIHMAAIGGGRRGGQNPNSKIASVAAAIPVRRISESIAFIVRSPDNPAEDT